MSKTTVMAVETWELTEMLAALCQIAQDAGDLDREPETDQKPLIAPELPIADQEGHRS